MSTYQLPETSYQQLRAYLQAQCGQRCNAEYNPCEAQELDSMLQLFKPTPQVQTPLTDREIELIDGMIEVQLDHATRCDNIQNRTMADKQKGLDMERVELLRKIKEKGIGRNQ